MSSLSDNDEKLLIKGVLLQDQFEKTPAGNWKEVSSFDCEFDGPYECTCCGGHIMFDATFIDQVEPTEITCPYCMNKNLFLD